jgi:hypothetical protein
VTFRDDYIKRIENEAAQLREWIAPLEAGKMHIGERAAGGPWVDKTQEMIARNERALGIYEAILAKVRADPAMFANVR